MKSFARTAPKKARSIRCLDNMQSPAPFGGGFVKAEWFKTYSATEGPEKFEMILQSWDSANKASELSDYSVCTTWGVKEKHIYLLHVFRKRLDYPDLKRAVKEQAEVFGPQTILIEDKASGTQLIQELLAEGMHAIQKYEPSMNKVIRMNTVTSMIECGFVHVPDKAAYLSEYLHELANFPNGKHDDQADSTSQALDWFKQQYVIPKEPWSMVLKYERWTELPGEFPGSGSSALFRDSGRIRIPSFTRS
jgi:predicted phage terminase large subunit-like protein